MRAERGARPLRRQRQTLGPSELARRCQVQELVTMIVKALVDEPERVVVNKIEGERSIIFEVRVAPDDLGKVIGKGGRPRRRG